MLCTLGKPPLAGVDAKENPPPPAALPAGWNLDGAWCYILRQRTECHGWQLYGGGSGVECVSGALS